MRTVLVLYAFALLVRLVLIALYPDPAYVDSYYYVNVARALQAGHGFNIDFIWTFVDTGGALPANPSLPIPSNAHWMPLASLVQVPFLLLAGPTALASALPFALVGALAAPMTWAFAIEAGARRDVAVGGRRPRRRPGRGGVHGPAGQLLAVPADRPRRPVARRPGAQGQRPGVRRGGRPRGPGDARSQRRHPRRRRPRTPLPVGALCRLACRPAGGRCRGGRRSPRPASSFS